MTEESVFTNLDPAQLHYLKAQYEASVQLLEQTELTLKQQLKDVGQARKHLEDQMRQLDSHLAPARATRQTSARRAS